MLTVVSCWWTLRESRRGDAGAGPAVRTGAGAPELARRSWRAGAGAPELAELAPHL